MGGASTQLTFVPQSPPKANAYNLNLSYTEYPLYTYSYPLGQDAALNILLQTLVGINVSRFGEGSAGGERERKRKWERKGVGEAREGYSFFFLFLYVLFFDSII